MTTRDYSKLFDKAWEVSKVDGVVRHQPYAFMVKLIRHIRDLEEGIDEATEPIQSNRDRSII